MTETVKRGPELKRITLIDRSGSAERTAIEHTDRSIEVVHFILARASRFLSYKQLVKSAKGAALFDFLSQHT
eukprot:2203193-Pyramimonas_sp.AAC.1